MTPSSLDYQGDSKMSGIHGINLSMLTYMINVVKSLNNGKGKDRSHRALVPCRFQNKFTALRHSSKCTQCTERGYSFKKYSKFTLPKRPTEINLAAVINSCSYKQTIDQVDKEDNMEEISGKE